MDTQDLRSLLDRTPGIRHPCDLDVLLFFHRHSSALLTSERLVACLGYDRERVAKSLDVLIRTGFVIRTQNPSRPSRLYVLERHGSTGGLLSSVLNIASARDGRHALMRLLESGPDRPANVAAVDAAHSVPAGLA